MPENQFTREIRESLPKHFCPMPFAQLFFYPTGEVFPCCESGYKLGDLTQSTLDEIWNGEAAQALRDEFLKGEIKTCASQIKHKQCHLSAESLLPVVVPSRVQEGPVRAFDLILNGRCNLECVMCPVWTLPNGTYDRSTFWSEGREKIFGGLERISVKSGEPFIQKDTYRLIDEVSRVNPECVWTLTTNGQYKLTRAILDSLDKIEIDSIKVSIDSLDPEVYSRIRLRGDLSKTLATLEGLIEYRKRRARAGRPFAIGVNMAVQRLNWREPPEMARFCIERGVEPIFLYVFEPKEQSLSGLSEPERAAVLEHYFLFLRSRPQLAPKLSTLVSPLLDGFSGAERTRLALSWKRQLLAAAFEDPLSVSP